MNEQNVTVQYVFQNSRDAAVLKSASYMISQGRADLAKNVLESAKIDANRLREMQMRSTVVISQGDQTRKAASW